MKKLLAIAVVAAMTVPAIADTSVYGSARVLVSKDTLTPGSQYTLSDNSSRIGLKGSNAIDNGLTMTHQIELGTALTGGAANMRGSWVGIKGGFGHVQIGTPDTVMDDVDGDAGFLTNSSFAIQPKDGDDSQIKYTGAFGPVTALASFRPKGNHTAGGTKAQIGLMYKAGPITAAIATASNTAPVVATTTTTKVKTKVALSYAGANYGVGFVHAIGDSAPKYKSNTLGGKYSFGKAYVAAAFGKGKATGITTKQTDFELGYGLGKGTKVYYENKKTKLNGATYSKSNGIGLHHDF